MTLGHMVPPKGAIGFSAIFAQEDRRGKRRFKTKQQATEAKRGRLRLTRTGSELAFAVTEGDGETFEELQRVQVATGDILSLRTSATSSGDACGLSVRLVEFLIRADDLPAKLGQGKESSWIPLIVWLLVIAVVGTGSFMLWRHWTVVWEHLPALLQRWPWRR